MNDYKLKTIQEENIVQIGGYYRYVNHTDKLATTGFMTREGLLEYTSNIRFDAGTIERMKERYDTLYKGT